MNAKYTGRNHHNFIDLTGKRFGRWTFVEVDESKSFGNGVWWVCRCECGTVKSRLAKSRKDKSCGCLQKEVASALFTGRSKEKHPCWKGGRLTTVQGYIRIMVPEHPRANAAGYVAEHIVVMEGKVGRELLPGETVHHINGVRGDNRPENLELWDSSHGPGQRHTDKMAFYTQEIVCKASDEELAIIALAIQRRINERK